MFQIRDKKEVQRSQTELTTLYVSWYLVNCCIAVQKSHMKRRAVEEWPWSSLKVIRIAAIG